jgi:hypothetical protein
MESKGLTMPHDDTQLMNQILTEMRELRGQVQDWRVNEAERLSKLEEQVRTGISGNGQPSRLAVVEDRVEALQRDRWFGAGIVAAMSSALTLGGGYLLRLITGR